MGFNRKLIFILLLISFLSIAAVNAHDLDSNDQFGDSNANVKCSSVVDVIENEHGAQNLSVDKYGGVMWKSQTRHRSGTDKRQGQGTRQGASRGARDKAQAEERETRRTTTTEARRRGSPSLPPLRLKICNKKIKQK